MAAKMKASLTTTRMKRDRSAALAGWSHGMNDGSPFTSPETEECSLPPARTGARSSAILLLIVQTFLWLFVVRTAGLLLWHCLRPFYYMYVVGAEVGILPGYFSRDVILPAVTILVAAVTAVWLGRIRRKLQSSS
jgi:hypothetical protein